MSYQFSLNAETWQPRDIEVAAQSKIFVEQLGALQLRPLAELLALASGKVGYSLELARLLSKRMEDNSKLLAFAGYEQGKLTSGALVLEQDDGLLAFWLEGSAHFQAALGQSLSYLSSTITFIKASPQAEGFLHYFQAEA